MAATVKQLLTTTETEIFKNWNDLPNSEIKAVNISLCNISAAAVDVWLSFCVISGMFSAGLVLSKTSIPAHDQITIEITERIILSDESVRAFASANNAISLSLDLVGDISQSEIPVYEIP